MSIYTKMPLKLKKNMIQVPVPVGGGGGGGEGSQRVPLETKTDSLLIALRRPLLK